MGQEIADRITTVAVGDLLAALSGAWRHLGFGEPERASIALLGSQWALETGWGKACHNWNLGNIKGVAGGEQDWQYFPCDEVIEGHIVWFYPPSPGCCFRAYESLAEGATDYLGFLRKKYSPTWPAILTGDPVAFVHALKVNHYFTADETKYEHGVEQIFHQLMASDFTTEPPTLKPEEQARILAISQASLLELSRELAAEDQSDVSDA